MDKAVLVKVVTSGSTRFMTTIGSIIFTILIPVYFSLEDLGEFTIALSIVLGLTLLPRFGFEKYILRVTGANADRFDATIKELISVMWIVVTICLLIFFLLTLVQAAVDFEFLKSGSFNILKYCILPLSVNRVFASYLNGSGKQELAPLFEPAAPSACAAVFFVLINLGWFESFDSVLYCWIAYAYLMFAVAVFYLVMKWVPDINIRSVWASFRRNLRELNDYFLSGISAYILSMGIFPLMGLSLSNADVGFFRLCERVVSFLNFILIILNNIFARRYALFWNRNEYPSVFREYKESLKMGWLISVPAVILLYFAAERILRFLLKGDVQFLSSLWVFYVLLLGAFLNIAYGGVMMVLNMTKHHNIAKNISITMSVFGIIAFLFLPRKFGLGGAAVAYLIFMFMLNSAGYYFAHTRVFMKPPKYV